MSLLAFVSFWAVLFVLVGFRRRLRRPLLWCLRPVTERVERRWREHRARRRQAPGPPIERISSDLRRLQRLLEEIERSNPPAKVARMRATSMAYDDVLLAACRALDVIPAIPEQRPPLHPVERLQAEAELARHGLTW